MTANQTIEALRREAEEEAADPTGIKRAHQAGLSAAAARLHVQVEPFGMIEADLERCGDPDAAKMVRDFAAWVHGLGKT